MVCTGEEPVRVAVGLGMGGGGVFSSSRGGDGASAAYLLPLSTSSSSSCSCSSGPGTDGKDSRKSEERFRLLNFQNTNHPSNSHHFDTKSEGS